MEGRTQFDLLLAIQRDHKLSSYSLNSVGYLGWRTLEKSDWQGSSSPGDSDAGGEVEVVTGPQMQGGQTQWRSSKH